MDESAQVFGSVPLSPQAIEEALEKMRGVACICASLSVSSEAGKSKYAGSEMALLCDVVESTIDDLEGLLT